MPTPSCENKAFEQQQQPQGFQLQPRTSTGGGSGAGDELPTIMVQSATPVATPVLEHKVFHVVQPTTLEAEQPEEMRSLSRSVSSSQGSHGQSSYRHSHSSSRWEEDLRKFRSESLGTSSRATQRPSSLMSTCSFEAYNPPAFDSDNSAQMSSIFEPETEAGLYDDDNGTGAVDIECRQYGESAQQDNAHGSNSQGGAQTTVSQVRVDESCERIASARRPEEPHAAVEATVTGTRPGFGTNVKPVAKGGPGPEVICIELEPPTPTTDEYPMLERGVISFQSPLEVCLPPNCASTVCQRHSMSSSSSTADGEQLCSTDNTEAMPPSPSSSSSEYHCTQHNSSLPSQPHDENSIDQTNGTVFPRAGSRETPAIVASNSNSNITVTTAHNVKHSEPRSSTTPPV
ncbi:hypothetical protein BIW11_11710 [Tropilaelaps mercedesae]|uniref:Uncharacterized protein n=1 Tax=Tropilaelaps mercedesae TaxID=418985 RepID=A0A1V9XAB9_9ACAR|nr:hypothetical protein BIW11_11710 [Tropilaelaps mercedesae]